MAVVIFPDMIRGCPFHSANNNREPTGPALHHGSRHGCRVPEEARGVRPVMNCLNEAVRAGRGTPQARGTMPERSGAAALDGVHLRCRASHDAGRPTQLTKIEKDHG